MSRLLTVEQIEAIQIPEGLDIQTDALWWDKLVAKAQDKETLKAVGKWLLKHPCPANPLKCDIRQRDLQALLRGEMPEEGV